MTSSRHNQKRWTAEDRRTVERWYGVVPLVELAARLDVKPHNLQSQAWRWGISGKMNRWEALAPARDADKRAEGFTLARLEREQAA